MAGVDLAAHHCSIRREALARPRFITSGGNRSSLEAMYVLATTDPTRNTAMMEAPITIPSFPRMVRAAPAAGILN
eukprot:CAMPEP_0182941416 /NCGR_PEP_ID=MMETSP0105_2-20130417/48914_1 /TAXON_ID=81532 ORGANISM="Acanthoeca-like sp., Strain 10tr" /NCGR_SAMPLE_ID=MMETSP0105_2 /ASSEMBLY_ACC=CAM_ASM_000205 /LENGTH=74 /DNA_ID=CAMNT_0025081037 /DNA_START=181 /DNA_END=402 /DNA_ORIENTATION=-